MALSFFQNLFRREGIGRPVKDKHRKRTAPPRYGIKRVFMRNTHHRLGFRNVVSHKTQQLGEVIEVGTVGCKATEGTRSYRLRFSLLVSVTKPPVAPHIGNSRKGQCDGNTPAYQRLPGITNKRTDHISHHQDKKRPYSIRRINVALGKK